MSRLPLETLTPRGTSQTLAQWDNSACVCRTVQDLHDHIERLGARLQVCPDGLRKLLGSSK
eukprot:CAMPEP_0197940484 /NCGR_PEP_ID=MMETSP1439-20131203/121311_1 /TAXON_ID=66791 /ORGANISM="Gonyaulax spinifera, Strain CCMP409" /LENGTH=60 /DNA_ID=CAMNT_0043563655 /DNA_START=12 /DNA_END=191 /DNA_ORIENTATION=-